MKTVENATKILDILISGHENMKANTIAERCGLNKVTAYKILNDLVKSGFVEKTHNNSRYGLGPKLLDVQSFVLEKTDLRAIARPIMEELASKCGEVINLMLLIKNAGYYLEIILPEGADRVDRIGETDCLYSTAVGKSILANMPRETVIEIIEKIGLKSSAIHTITNLDSLFEELSLTKERGFAVEDEESKNGVRCVAAPIFSSYGEVIAAISISGLTNKVTISRLLEYSSFVVEAARKISESL